ncbi:MAG: aldehyde ferredoxin oxidoreductase family protein [Deltaproteobacteria bacterium]|nr:aldehyde ferredoxin oxidoreductase family protein [Deltaproteobacteria bacterium]
MSPHWRALDIDLSTGRIFNTEFPESRVRLFLGGRGLGAAILRDLTGPGTEPLGSDTPLIFATGPLTGAGVPSGDRFSLSTLSPLTGTVLDTNSGGRLGRSLKRAGWDLLIIRGAAQSLSILKVDNSGGELLPAGEMRGERVSTVLGKLGRTYGKSCGMAVIGPAGERVVRYASIMTERMRAMGRGGAGAVMGSKNLKAIVVMGSGEVKVHDRGRLKVVLEESNRWLRAHPVTSKALPALGTPMLVNICTRAGIFPMANFRRVAVGESKAYSGELLAREFTVGRSGCTGCYIRCGRITEVDGVRGEGPEYESLWALGPNLDITDLKAIIRAAHLCNELGLDTISTGGTLSCAMELGSLDIRRSSLNFGDSEAVLKAIGLIAAREGEGDELAEGSRTLSRKAGAEEYSMQVKGLELPGYDPRGVQGQGLAYATSSRGGCHLRGGYLIAREVLGIPKKVSGREVLGKGGHVARAQDFGAVADSLSSCRFATFALTQEYWSRMVSAVTGWEMSGEDMMRAGERIINLERILNVERGIEPEQDTLPRRFLSEPLGEGACAGEVVRLDDMLEEYYARRGWPGGVPDREKREELGLS